MDLFMDAVQVSTVDPNPGLGAPANNNAADNGYPSFLALK